MWVPLLERVPSFQTHRDDFLAKWQTDGEPLPEFLCVHELTAFTIEAFAREDFAKVRKIIQTVETWLETGDEDVADLATTGFLEDLGNRAMHKTTTPDDFEQFMSKAVKQDSTLFRTLGRA